MLSELISAWQFKSPTDTTAPLHSIYAVPNFIAPFCPANTVLGLSVILIYSESSSYSNYLHRSIYTVLY